MSMSELSERGWLGYNTGICLINFDYLITEVIFRFLLSFTVIYSQLPFRVREDHYLEKLPVNANKKRKEKQEKEIQSKESRI